MASPEPSVPRETNTASAMIVNQSPQQAHHLRGP